MFLLSQKLTSVCFRHMQTHLRVPQVGLFRRWSMASWWHHRSLTRHDFRCVPCICLVHGYSWMSAPTISPHLARYKFYALNFIVVSF